MKENKSSKITRKRQMLLIRKEKNMNCSLVEDILSASSLQV